MINFLQSLNISNYESLISNFETSSMKCLPIHLYWKNKKGVYLGNNDYQAQHAGYNSAADLNGKTDYDLSWSNEAAIIRNNDTIILQTKKPRTFIEFGTVAEGYQKKCLSYKLPLYGRSKKILGILGFSLMLDDDLYVPASIDLQNLTKRQRECVFWLVRGFTHKQIGKKLNISHRTVEGHLEFVKEAFNCSTRAELIEKISSKTLVV